MEMAAHIRDGVEVIKLKGDLVLGEPVDQLQAMVDEFHAGGMDDFVLDLSEVRMIDSSGLGIIVRMMATLRKSQGSLKLVNPQAQAMQLFKTVGLATSFEIYPDEAAAVGT